MAAYSIVLNLSGSAVSRSATLAKNFDLAATNATKLATALSAVNAVSRAIPNRTIRVSGVGGVQNSQTTAAANAQLRAAAAQTRAATVQTRAATAQTAAARAQTKSAYTQNYTRHRSTRIASFGSGFSFGPFSGRLSTILQPDANGQIAGLDAAKLIKGVNIAGIAAELVKKIGTSVYKVIKYSTVVPPALAATGLSVAIRTLQSESFAEGTRLISRRHQARLGLGKQFLQAEANTDFLAQAYGFDRSTTLSSINTLTGLGIGGGQYKLNLAEATGLTKVGGLISQHHGVPFERVMTNLQQLLVQSVPHMRDIRELLNQAPILGKYALREIESRGLKGVDIREYLKDQKNLLSALKAYELDVATNAGQQARGRIGLAKQNAWADVAGNETAWRYVGQAGVDIIGSIGTAANSLLSMLANSTRVQNEVNNLVLTFDNIGKLFEHIERTGKTGIRVIDKFLVPILKDLESFGRLDPGNMQLAREKTAQDQLLRGLLDNPYFRAGIEADLRANGGLTSLTPERQQTEINEKVVNAFTHLFDNPQVRDAIFLSGAFYTSDNSSLSAGQRQAINLSRFNATASMLNTPYYQGENILSNLVNPARWGRSDWKNPGNAYAGGFLNIDTVLDVARDFLAEQRKTGTFDPNNIKLAGGDAGDDLKGFNRDRRALTINFNAPIVQWDANIITDNSEQTVNDVADNIELIASAGIQKALLGASNKLGTRWY